jgi:hypothetical protein
VAPTSCISERAAETEQTEQTERHPLTSSHIWEQRHVRSGYDQTDVIVDIIDLADLADLLAVGMAIYDTESKRVGELTQYDSARDVLVVDQGLQPRMFYIPFSEISEVDVTEMFVLLVFPEAALERDYATPPRTDGSGTTQVMDPTVE